MASKSLRLFLSYGKASAIPLLSLRKNAVKKGIAKYYTKPENRRGQNLQAWLVAGGVVASLTGCSIVVLGKLRT